MINNRLSASHGSGWASTHTKEIREIRADWPQKTLLSKKLTKMFYAHL